MNERTISWDRLCEIATMALHRIAEIDRDSAQRFIQEEIFMNENEMDFFELKRKRTATNIEWEDEDSTLPTEIEIPWMILDDDIDCYLSEEYGCCVLDYVIEEEDE